ncbi:phosphotransferase [Pedococcus sp. NPDC057267]|uniref:phosphotransferase n=1 Tax=Pedococcus sp. NPDC057267 TaxID=3346077 RepID=UPI0036274A20
MPATTQRTYRALPGVSDEVYEQAVSFLDRQAADLMRGEVTLAMLQGGASNVNLVVESGGDRYALRLCDADAARWGVDRAAAITAQNQAAQLGLAPRVLAFELPQGDYLAEFIPGFQLTPELLREERYLAMVAGAWRRLNVNSTTSRTFSPFDDARTFIDCADADDAPRPERLDEMLAALLRIESLFVNRDLPQGFCHSDSVPQNYLVDGEVIRLVDFDYAGYGWTAFELGSLCCQAELDDWQTTTLLETYDPDADEGQRARVELMRFVAGIREATWALMAEPYLGYKTKPLDGWTYEGHAQRNIRQAAQVIDSGAFDDYLRLARQLRPGARC